MIQINIVKYKQVVIAFFLYCSIHSIHTHASIDNSHNMPPERTNELEFADTDRQTGPSTTHTQPVEEKIYGLDIEPIDIHLDDVHSFSDEELLNEEGSLERDKAQEEKAQPIISKPRTIQSILVEGN